MKEDRQQLVGGALGAGPFQQYKRAVEGVADIADICHAFHAKVFAKTMLIVQPGAAQANVESGIIYGLSSILHERMLEAVGRLRRRALKENRFDDASDEVIPSSFELTTSALAVNSLWKVLRLV